MAIFSIQVEKHVLAGLVKYPAIFADVSTYLTSECFFNEVHNTIFLVIKSCFDKNERWDKVLLAEKIKNIGVTFKDDINIYDYIDNLSYIPITQLAVIDAVKELIKIRIRRGLELLGQDIQQTVRKNGNMTIDEIISEVDTIYGNKASVYEIENQPESLFKNAEQEIEERGNNPSEESGISTPYPEFNSLYGGLRTQNVYAVASRAGGGKTSWIDDLCFKTGDIHKIKSLICDTEMSTWDVRDRVIAAISGVPLWFIQTGNWRKKPEMVPKVRDSLNRVRAFDLVNHYHIGSKNIDQIISIIRRWHHSHIKNDELSIVAYDYIKLVSSTHMARNWSEHQVIGEIVDKLKRLSEELNCVILTAIQMNRTGENFNRKSSDVIDDSSAIADSDRLQRYASFVGILRRKTLDEIALDGIQFGTHKLIPVKTRFQGKDAAGHHDLVKRPNEHGDLVWVNNYINFKIENFDVKEMGSLRTIINTVKAQPDDQNPNDGNTL